MRTKTIQQSFGGGRMSPDMLGRPEDPRVRFGLSKATNVRTTTAGGFESRTGTQFIGESNDHDRVSIVRSFASSPTDSVVMAITGWDGNPSNWGTIRFISNGAFVPTGSFPAYGSMVWTISPLSVGTVIRVTVSTHGFSGGEPIRFTSAGNPPGPIVVGVTYYVRNIIDANNFTLAFEPNGAEIQYDAVTVSSGLSTIHRRYLQGDVVTRSGTAYTALFDVSAVVPGVTSGWEDYWYPQGGTDFEVPHRYADADLVDLDTSSQEGNTLTIAHRNYPVRELVRESSTFWRLRNVSFVPTVLPPKWAPTAIVPYAGEVFNIVVSGTGNASPGGAPTRLILVTQTEHPYAVGEVLYVAGLTGLVGVPDGFYAVGAKNSTSTTIDLRSYTGGEWVAASSGTYTGGGTVRSASASSILSNFYRITSLDADGRESDGGAASGALNNLEVGGSYNTLTWLPASGAVAYRVYRANNDRYQLLDETTVTSYRDVGDAVDSEFTLPVIDNTINSTSNYYPSCVALFEGRRLFFSTIAEPLGAWGTRSGTSSDMSKHRPLVPDDRIKFTMRSQSSIVNHAVAQSQTLLLLTDSEEIRVAALESGALTADQPVPARPITRNGSTKRLPAVVGGTVVFENRGGQLLELGFRSDAGWQVQSLSERCADWFDGYALADGIAVQRSPIPTLWAVQEDGRLLGLTYAPEQAVAGWHEHTTAGEFESVCCIPEGREDAVYVVVRRSINGSTVRYFERMAPRYFDGLEDRRYVDSFLTFDGTNTTATTLTLTGGTDWEAGESITLTASAATFAYPATTDRGDQIKWMGLYRVRITATSSTTVATGTIIDDFAAAPSGASAVWTWGRDTVAGLGHLEGETVQIVADGVVMKPQTVTSGAVSLYTRASLGSPSAATVGFKVHVGLGYTAEAIPTPPAVPVDGLGQGRNATTTHIHVRTRRSAPFYFGPLGGPEQSLNRTREDDDFTGSSRLVVDGKFTLDKQIRMVQTDPLPMVVTGAVYTLSWGD